MLKEIFYGRELTIEPTLNCILSKWHPRKKAIKIPNSVVYYLIKNNILEEDSGNFDTGEIHYIYNTEIGDKFECDKEMLDLLKPVIREIRLNYLLFKKT